jgi:hypothetical protein
MIQRSLNATFIQGSQDDYIFGNSWFLSHCKLWLLWGPIHFTFHIRPLFWQFVRLKYLIGVTTWNVTSCSLLNMYWCFDVSEYTASHFKRQSSWVAAWFVLLDIYCYDNQVNMKALEYGAAEGCRSVGPITWKRERSHIESKRKRTA